MGLGQAFERFVQNSAVTVMMRGTMERLFHPDRLNELFQKHACAQYNRHLPFSSVAEVLGEVVFNVQPSVGAALQSRAEELPVSRKAFYKKLNGVEPPVSAALVGDSAEQLAPVIEQLSLASQPVLPGYCTRLLDGNHFAATERRLDVLRSESAAPLPGQALAILDPDRRLVLDVVPSEDGHAGERELLEQVLPLVGPGQLWIADRNFCTRQFLFGIVQRRGRFLIRLHAQLPYETLGKRHRRGRTESGLVWEQKIELTDPETGGAKKARLIIIELDQPTQDGETEIRLITNLPVKDASAVRVARTYRKRWKIETLFQELTEHLTCEIKTLAYPKAAVFAFCLALLAWNGLSLILHALASVHDAQTIREQVSGYYISLEISQVYHGMMIAIPDEQWSIFREFSDAAFAEKIKRLAEHIDLAKYQKHPRGPKAKSPERRNSGHGQHVATAKLICRKD